MLFLSCAKKDSKEATLSKNTVGFEALPLEKIGIDFTNSITENQIQNYFNYPYLYNGGGVAVGDINNDGLADIYFTGNQVEDQLYLNLGNISFKNITEEAGISKQKNSWHTGVLMWDANNDGLLDIYVCRSGKSEDASLRKNLLYINNGNNSFTESAALFGIDDSGYSTQAYPIDFDKDGDLDLLVVNHRVYFQQNSFFDFDNDLKYSHDTSHRLYQNNGDHTFSDVSIKAGIQTHAWGLSAVIEDFNNDGWDDIYVAHDFQQPDKLFVNNQDGTFKETFSDYFNHSSFYSMGSDMADINNDNLPDLMVLDMVSEDHLRSKRMMASMNTQSFYQMVEKGYGHQYMINTLQLNNGIGTYSEIAQLAGVAKTDWSWAPLLADFDNDGWNDLFVTNGIKKDVTDNDLKIRLDRMLKEGNGVRWDVATEMIPASVISNYMFKNTGHLGFKNVTQDWGLSEPINSNGVAYADLDNDGDLDLVVNSMGVPSVVFENKISKTENYVSLQLKGLAPNPFVVGAKVSIYSGEEIQSKRLFPSRGFQSSVEYRLHFGLGQKSIVDSIVVEWADGYSSRMTNISANQNLLLNSESLPKTITKKKEINNQLFREVTEDIGIDFEHRENEFNDFAEEILLPHKQSEFGPFIAVGDVNGDGLEDFFVGGAHKQSGVLYLQKEDGTFYKSKSQPWEKDLVSEDLESLFFDADGDGDLDLYVVSGGAIFVQGNPNLQDRLYINDGKGIFKKDLQALPEMFKSGLSVTGGDFDGDGDTDLFVGGRLISGRYPLPPRSYLLENINGKFTDVTDLLAPSLLHPGLVSDAVFTDFDKDGDLDLMVVGEWMPISLYENDQGFFMDATSKFNLENTSGWWSKITVVDWDKDGDDDYILGNIGENNKFHPSENSPLHIYANDFDGNGSFDIYLAKEKGDLQLPVRGRECSSQQMPGILDKFPTYDAFSKAKIEDILGVNGINNAYHKEVTIFSSLLLQNHKTSFTQTKLPVEAQFSQLNGMVIHDFNDDTYPDVLLVGNNYGSEVETTRYDALQSVTILNDKIGGFKVLSLQRTGLTLSENVKSISRLNYFSDKNSFRLLLGCNNHKIKVFQKN
ncbi:VCBS repeat-containing protein [Aureisphaera sp. CAU 1614]|uniref:VCBS repeat-containing protein n=1 Tax=Halomarinibacterium sedimenti TaxID=2857106 RepID=A0A9X1JWF9_9FLAO|nr:FG-GAP-like repeat-containing protein [Halomarinibacterium sedimenti]MBW2939094.1 VCBS repeat-containing protein [Halomarinibacterium sedimenti]